eukprot:scaffold9183_cov117-Skeletonema_dohrnii-CCMP3373.AAC.5
MDEFHIPRKKNFAPPPAEAASSDAATDASSSQTKGDDGAAGDIATTPSKSKSGEPTMSSPDKSPGGRKILRRGDLVRLSNE